MYQAFCLWFAVAWVAWAGAAFSLIPVESEIAIGREAQAQVRSQMAVLRDRDVSGYVSDLGRRLASGAGGPRYPYTFTVADYREVNAFALPGGPVWIHRGVLEATRTEAQLAAVLAHEVAHISRRHAAGQLTKALVADIGLGLLGALLGNGRSAQTTQLAARFLAAGAFLKFSRDDEREADREGVAIMLRAGYHPAAMIEMLEIVRARAAREPSAVETFVSTHPSPQDRIEELRAATAGRTGRRDGARFHAMQRRLRELPPARSMPPQR